MARKRASLALALGMTGALLWVKGTVPKPDAATARSEGIDVSELYRNAPTTLPSFDDSYQRYLGILDVLRTYP
jgi:hypothetical protein